MPFSILPSGGLKFPTAGKIKISLLRRFHVRERPGSTESQLREIPQVNEQDGDSYEPKPISLDSLPYDVLVDILYFLDFDDFVSARLVCHSLFEASDTLELWHNLAFRMQSDSTALVLDDFTHPKTLPFPALKSAVLQSAYLHRNWDCSPTGSPPKLINSKATHLGLSITEFLPVAAAFVTDDYFIMPSEEYLSCIDIKGRKRVEDYRLGLKKPLISLHIDLDSRDAFAVVVGRNMDRKHRLHVVLIRLPPTHEEVNEERETVNDNEDSAGDTGSKANHQVFKRVREIEIPSSWVVITLLANAATRTICLLVFTHPAPQTLKLFTIFDWNEMGKSCVVDTGLTLEAPYHRKTTHVRFAGDMSDVVAVKEDETGWEQRRFSLSAMKSISSQSTSPSPPFPTFSVSFSVSSSTLGLPAEPEGFHVGRSLYWTHLHCYHTYPGVPSRYSHAYLYKRRKLNEDGTPSNGNSEAVYMVAQHYALEDGPQGDGKRFVLEMKNPVTVSYDDSLTVPLMGVSFNHMVWIEQEEVPPLFPPPTLSAPESTSTSDSNTSTSTVSNFGRTVCARQMAYRMRFVKFPDPADPEGSYTVTTLAHIDSDVAEMAYQILLEPTMAAIMITTKTNYFWRFQYA